MKRNHTRFPFLAIAVTSALLGLAACETAPDSSALLEQARSAVAQAEADPNVAKYAPTELDRARKLLVNAEGSARQKGAKDQPASHYAYLTTQMARIAQQRAQEQAATTRIKAGETERQQILLSVLTLDEEGLTDSRGANDYNLELNRRVEIIVSNSDAAIPGRAAGAP